MEAPSTPGTLGPYRLLERIGEGGMGVVHLAVAPDGGLVAVKVLRPNVVAGADGRARLAREVSALGRVRGPRIAEVLDADTTTDAPYVVTRYVPGRSLDRVVSDHGPLRGEALLRLAHGLADALAAVHTAGVVHRDVKPGNVVLHDGQPVLIDFGLARGPDEARLTATGLMVGTPSYLAPETVAGAEPTAATDVHGWAATLVFAATGHPPYGEGNVVALLDRIRRGEIQLDGVDARLRPFLEQALRDDPGRRPPMAWLRDRLADRGPVPAPRDDPAATIVTGRPVSATRHDIPVPQPASVPQPQPTSTSQPQPATLPHALPVPDPYGGRPAVPPPRPLTAAAGRLTALGLLGATVTGTALAPYVALSVLGVLLVLARTTDRVQRRSMERRMVRGPRGLDPWLAALAAPWHALVAVVPAGLQFVVVSTVAALAALAVDVATRGTQLPLLAAGLAAGLTAWGGPGSSAVRRGLRIALAGPGQAARAGWVVTCLVVAGAWLLGLWWESYGTSWWPYAGPPRLPSWV